MGLGLPEAVLVFEEAGRALLPGPLAACQLLAGTVDGAATGERIVGLCDAAAEPALWEHPRDCDEVILVDGRPGPGQRRRGYRSSASAVSRTALASVDPLTPLARVTDRPQGTPLPLDAARLRREAALLAAAQQLGSAARTVEMAVAYAREREQFGAAIGSFQAVKHLCAQMLVRAEVARSAVYAAAVTQEALEVDRGEAARRRRRGAQRPGLPPGARRDGLHLGGGRSSAPQACLAAGRELGYGARGGAAARRGPRGMTTGP